MFRSSYNDLYPKQNFQINVDLTLTFDLVTLTFSQLEHTIHTSHMSKYHYGWIILSSFRVETNFSHHWRFDLDLWPCDLDLWSMLTLYISLTTIQWYVRDLYPKLLFFYITAYLTLTFDLVTLTFRQLQRCINMNTLFKADEDPIICS